MTLFNSWLSFNSSRWLHFPDMQSKKKILQQMLPAGIIIKIYIVSDLTYVTSRKKMPGSMRRMLEAKRESPLLAWFPPIMSKFKIVISLFHNITSWSSAKSYVWSFILTASHGCTVGWAISSTNRTGCFPSCLGEFTQICIHQAISLISDLYRSSYIFHLPISD